MTTESEQAIKIATAKCADCQSAYDASTANLASGVANELPIRFTEFVKIVTRDQADVTLKLDADTFADLRTGAHTLGVSAKHALEVAGVDLAQTPMTSEASMSSLDNRDVTDALAKPISEQMQQLQKLLIHAGFEVRSLSAHDVVTPNMWRGLLNPAMDARKALRASEQELDEAVAADKKSKVDDLWG